MLNKTKVINILSAHALNNVHQVYGLFTLHEILTSRQTSGLLVRDSPESLWCVLEHDTLSAAYPLVQPRKTGNNPNMTEKLLTGM